MLHETVFSCAGSTRKIADKIVNGLCGEIAVHDLLDKDFNGTVIEGINDIVGDSWH